MRAGRGRQAPSRRSVPGRHDPAASTGVGARRAQRRSGALASEVSSSPRDRSHYAQRSIWTQSRVSRSRFSSTVLVGWLIAVCGRSAQHSQSQSTARSDAVRPLTVPRLVHRRQQLPGQRDRVRFVRRTSRRSQLSRCRTWPSYRGMPQWQFGRRHGRGPSQCPAAPPCV